MGISPFYGHAGGLFSYRCVFMSVHGYLSFLIFDERGNVWIVIQCQEI